MIMKDDWSKSLSRPNSIWLGRYRGDPLFWTELSRDDGGISLSTFRFTTNMRLLHGIIVRSERG